MAIWLSMHQAREGAKCHHEGVHACRQRRELSATMKLSMHAGQGGS